MVSGTGLHKQKAPFSHVAEEMGLHFSCNTIAGHVIFLFEVQKTDRN
jgi:hypothetical protein